jgi:hypothetical protein
MTHPFFIEEVERAIRMRGWHPGRTVVFKRALLKTYLLRYTGEGCPLTIDSYIGLIHTEEMTLLDVEFHRMFFRAACKKTYWF